MATVTPRRPSAKPRKSDLTVSLALAIDHQAYSVTPIRPQDPDVSRAWRLEKKGGDGAVYDVAATIHGHTCDCPDFEVRRNGIDPAGCKHVRACVQMGLLDAVNVPAATEVEPTPAPAPTAKRTAPVIDDFYAKLQAASRTFAAESDIEPAPSAERCCLCHRPGVHEESGMSWCSMHYDEAIHPGGQLNAPVAAPAPVEPAPCCQPSEPAACIGCKSTPSAPDVATAILDRGMELARAEVEPAAPVGDWTCQKGDCGGCQSDASRDPEFTPPCLGDEAAPTDEAPTLDDHVPTPAEEVEAAEAFVAADCQAFLDRSGTLPLVESLDRISTTFRAWSNPFGTMLADVIADLATKAFMTGATTPGELLTGIATLEREARETWERVGRESVAKDRTAEEIAHRRGRPQPQNAFGAQPFHRHLV